MTTRNDASVGVRTTDKPNMSTIDLHNEIMITIKKHGKMYCQAFVIMAITSSGLTILSFDVNGLQTSILT